MAKTLKVLELKVPTVSNDSCSGSLTCKIDEEPLFQAVTFKLPEFQQLNFYNRLNIQIFGGVVKDVDSLKLLQPGVSHFKDISCTFCECQKEKGMRYVLNMKVDLY